MLDVARAYLFVFGVASIAGGAVGFVKAKSKPSLIAGGIAGVLLLVAGYLVGAGNHVAGLGLGAVVSVALAGRFGPQFAKTKKVMPAGVMAALAIGGIATTAAAFFVK